jgi:hypothetical protein
MRGSGGMMILVPQVRRRCRWIAAPLHGGGRMAVTGRPRPSEQGRVGEVQTEEVQAAQRKLGAAVAEQEPGHHQPGSRLRCCRGPCLRDRRLLGLSTLIPAQRPGDDPDFGVTPTPTPATSAGRHVDRSTPAPTADHGGGTRCSAALSPTNEQGNAPSRARSTAGVPRAPGADGAAREGS